MITKNSVVKIQNLVLNHKSRPVKLNTITKSCKRNTPHLLKEDEVTKRDKKGCLHFFQDKKNYVSYICQTFLFKGFASYFIFNDDNCFQPANQLYLIGNVFLIKKGSTKLKVTAALGKRIRYLCAICASFFTQNIQKIQTPCVFLFFFFHWIPSFCHTFLFLRKISTLFYLFTTR